MVGRGHQGAHVGGAGTPEVPKCRVERWVLGEAWLCDLGRPLLSGGTVLSATPRLSQESSGPRAPVGPVMLGETTESGQSAWQPLHERDTGAQAGDTLTLEVLPTWGPHHTEGNEPALPRPSGAGRQPRAPPFVGLLQLGSQFPDFDLQLRPLPGRLVQHPAGIGQLCLVQRLDATHLGAQQGPGEGNPFPTDGGRPRRAQFQLTPEPPLAIPCWVPAPVCQPSCLP